ncbi:class I SAM-dependent methyltransferase [Geomicrobium sp. JCM 19039]|uniref:tRNA (adenine(22)-N(1))-methyltransferase n=1 Tax=Geomicrobium sp. JCM 19039 TaxID=1460636 RepID=UPI00045F1832|nr:class I SAM-dependent methyltransferase [Geomicrobium sp. JCM 19039]GAK11479.1 putative tRNA-m1A22 methylase [Geomicrobium sp. JCM 19039]
MELIERLSERLRVIALEVEAGAVLADIGTDHAQLPEALVQAGIIQSAVASDVNAGPFQTALRNIESSGLSRQISVRHGSGLEPLRQEDHISTVTIAGMGGSLIKSILDEGNDKLNGVNTLILQANVAADLLREWLYAQGWQIVKEKLVRDADHFYEVIVAKRGHKEAPYHHTGLGFEEEMMFGPLLLHQGGEAFIAKWEGEYEHLTRVKGQIAIANHQDQQADSAYGRIDQQLKRIKEALAYVKSR